MKLNLILVLTASALALAACSSTKSKVDSGPIRGRTFSFVQPPPQSTADRSTDNTQAVHAMVQQAITRNLGNRGITRVPSGGQITVAYLIITGTPGATRRITDYYGSGEQAAALHSKAHRAYTNNENRDYYEAGTLVIDLIDASNYKLLKRNYASRQILRQPENIQAARIQEVVDEILNDLRVGS